MRLLHRQRSAVTFTEFVIAFFLLGMAIVPLHLMFSRGLDTFQEMRDYLVVMNAAEAQIHKYINIISNLAPGETINLHQEDISGEVVSQLSDSLSTLSGLKVLATVRLSTYTDGAGAYDIIMEAIWGSHGKFQLFTVVPVRDHLNAAETL